MGKLHLGEMTEMAQRIRNAENTKVVKVKAESDGDTDAVENWVINDIEIPEDSGDWALLSKVLNSVNKIFNTAQEYTKMLYFWAVIYNNYESKRGRIYVPWHAQGFQW